MHADGILWICWPVGVGRMLKMPLCWAGILRSGFVGFTLEQDA